ncbi:MAG: PAS domain S-box protein, partial [Desulfobacteraceae bacterium]
GLYWISRIESPALNGYLLFHGIVEIFSIVVACAIFMIAWNSRRLLDNHYLLFMGIAFLFVSVLDFVHTLAFKGMAIFPDSGSNPTTQLWIAARYLESLSFLIALFFIKRKVRTELTFTVFTLISGLLLLSIFYWKIFPDCFVEGSGLTVFKKTSEFIISAVILAAIAGLIRSRHSFDRGMLRFLILGLAFKIVSEISFTLYVDLYGIPNLIGHYFKIISFYFFYRAIIQIGLQKPYDLLFRSLKQSEARYRHIIEDQTELICRFSEQGRLTFVNRAFGRFFNQEERDLLGRGVDALFLENDQELLRKQCGSCTLQNPVSTSEFRVTAPGREIRWLQWTCRAIYNPRGDLLEFQAVGKEITLRKQAEEALQKAHAELEKRVAERTKELSQSNILLKQSETELRRLSAKLLKAQESERKLVALELHDGIGQGMSAVKFGVENGLQKMEKGDPAGAGEALKPLIPMIQQTMEDVRRMARNLWPSILDDLGILAALSWFTREYEKIYAPITVERRIELEEKDVPNDLKIILFRIIQEALNNIAKHSHAQQVYLALEKTDEILLTIRDQGRGFEVEKMLSGDSSGRGLGLAGMKERAELSGGRFTIQSRPGEGTVIRASWAV